MGKKLVKSLRTGALFTAVTLGLLTTGCGTISKKKIIGSSSPLEKRVEFQVDSKKDIP